MLGGKSFCAQHGFDADKVLSRGQLFKGKCIFRPGKPNRCDENVFQLAAKSKGKIKPVSGYALSEDGLWYAHTWGIRSDDAIVETTEKRVLYFGYIVTEEDMADWQRAWAKAQLQSLLWPASGGSAGRGTL